MAGTFKAPLPYASLPTVESGANGTNFPKAPVANPGAVGTDRGRHPENIRHRGPSRPPGCAQPNPADAKGAAGTAPARTPHHFSSLTIRSTTSVPRFALWHPTPCPGIEHFCATWRVMTSSPTRHDLFWRLAPNHSKSIGLPWRGRFAEERAENNGCHGNRPQHHGISIDPAARSVAVRRPPSRKNAIRPNSHNSPVGRKNVKIFLRSGNSTENR